MRKIIYPIFFSTALFLSGCSSPGIKINFYDLDGKPGYERAEIVNKRNNRVLEEVRFMRGESRSEIEYSNIFDGLELKFISEEESE